MTEIRLGFDDRLTQASDERAAELRDQLIRDRVASRIFEKDATLWGAAAEEEASIRLGWTDFAQTADELFPQLDALRENLRGQGVDRIVLCGMGGSSLAPAVITRWAGVPLTMIDSTHPDVVGRALTTDLDRTAVVVSSKSGSTIETRSHLAAFEQAFRDASIDPAARIVIVTDPGSPLEEASREAGRHVMLADPNVGGRFSALTAFGLTPSALAGADVRKLVADAQGARASLSVDSTDNAALQLAAMIAASLPERSVLALRSAPDADWRLGAWIEQLIAESTGKDGVGVLPIELDWSSPEFEHTPANTIPVTLTAGTDLDAPGITVSAELGAQVLLWEVTTALLGRLMGVDPFNQPDVESAKVAARNALVSPSRIGELPDAPDTGEFWKWLRDFVDPPGYLVLQAFLDPSAQYAADLAQLRDRAASELGIPVALSWGPSYLHSTGQLHKGGPAVGTFVQLVDTNLPALHIPGSDSGFDTLITAQAMGDREVLQGHGRPVLTIATPDPGASIAALLA